MLALPAIVLGGWYGTVLTVHYRKYGDELSDFAAVLDRAPPGRKAMWLPFDRGSRVMNVESALVGLPAYYSVERRAPGSMVPMRYCGMRHVPCRPTELGLRLPAPGAWSPDRFDPGASLAYFDLIFVRGGPPPEQLFHEKLDEVAVVAHAGRWTLWQKRTQESK